MTIWRPGRDDHNRAFSMTSAIRFAMIVFAMFRIVWLTALASAVATIAVAGDRFDVSVVPASAVRVVDGDTIAIGREAIRIAGIDAPDILRPKCIGERRKGAVAMIRLRQLVSAATHVRIDRRGENFFHRTIADVYLDERDAAAAMIADGHAKPSPRGKRLDWCTFIHPPLTGGSARPILRERQGMRSAAATQGDGGPAR